MKVVLGIERWTIIPETLEEFIIFKDYMNRLPKVSVTWDETTDIVKVDKMIQVVKTEWSGISDFPYMLLDFDPDENLEKT